MSASGFVGSVVRIQSTGRPDTLVTVQQPGSEYMEINGGAGYLVDIGNYTATINKVGFIAFLFSSPGPAQFGGDGFNGLTFSDVNNDLPYIRGAWLGNQVGLSGLGSSDLTTTENSVTIDFQSVIFNDDHQVTINVDFNDAPVAPDLGLRALEGAPIIAGPLSSQISDLDLSDTTFTFSLVQTTQFGSLLFLSAGSFIYTPTDPNFFGQDKFTFQVSDGFGGTDQGDFYIDVLAQNDAPEVTNETLTAVVEDSAARTISFASLLANDSAGPANESTQTLTITELRNAVGGTVVIDGTNVIFTPSANFNGTASFEYVVQDNGTSQRVGSGNAIESYADGKTAVAKTSFQIAPVSDAPSGTSKILAINGNTVYTITAADFGFSDPADGHGLLGVLIDPPTGQGSLKLAGAALTTGRFVSASDIDAGRLTFAPLPNGVGNNYGAFSFQVMDNANPVIGGDTLDPTPNQLTFNVTPMDDTPIVTAKTNQFIVNSTTANDQFDPKVVALNDGRLMLVWTSEVGAGAYEIRGRVMRADGTPVDRDGAGGGTDGDFKINFTTAGAQEQPSIAVLANGGFVATWYDNGEIRAAAFDSSGFAIDPDGTGPLAAGDFVVNTTTAGLQHRPSVAALAGGGYVITWQTAGASAGSYEVYGKAFSATNVPATANDVHVSSQTGANQNNPAAGPQPSIAGLTNGNYVVTWQYGANGTEVLYRIVSPAGAAITDTFQANPIDPDFQGNARVAALQNGRFAIVWSDEVAPGDFDLWVRTYDSSGNPFPVIYRVNSVTTGVQGTPAITQLGDGRIAVAWRDDENVDGSSDINVRILESTGAPADRDGNGAPDGDIVVNASATGVSDPAPGITGLPNGGFAVAWKSGSPGDIQARTFSPIVANNDSLDAFEDSGLAGLVVGGVGRLLFNDSYAGGLKSLTVQAYSAATAHGNVNVTADGAFDYSPNANYFGPDSFTYTVTDGVFRATATVNVTVHSSNDPPVAGDDSVTVAEDSGATTIDVLGNDSAGPANENQTLTVTAVTQPANGVVSLNNGVVTFTPNANFAGTTSFSYTVSDGGPDNGDGNTDTATVTVTVPGSPDAPVANAVNATGAEDAPSIEITLTGSDADAGDAVETFTVAALPANGVLFLDAGLSQPVAAGQAYQATSQQLKLYFVPADDFFGAASFDYVANDGSLNSAPATATVTVTAENDPPDAVDDTVTVEEDSGATIIGVLANDDAGAANENQTLTVTAVTQPANGAVSSATAWCGSRRMPTSRARRASPTR